MRSPSRTRPAKKSETLEVRISYPLKSALVAHCRENGVTVSDAVRQLIEDRLDQEKRRRWLNRERIKPMTALLTHHPRKAAGSGMAAIAALSLGLVPASVASDGRAVFDGLDADGDGFVARDEFVAGVVDDDYGLSVPGDAGSLREISTGELTGAAHGEFQRYDRNRDNRLSFDEFSGRYLERMRYAFSWLDEDQNGFLSDGELSVSFGGAGALTARALVDELDRDGDGLLSYGEFIDMPD
jgi:Ca2+-binding EF-hand superfamily protein